MNKKTKAKLLEKFEDLSLDVTNSDEKMAAEFLTSMGINPDEESEYGVKVIQRANFLAKAHANRNRDMTMLETLHAKLMASMEKNAQLTVLMLQNLLTQNKASFQFRNIEKWTETEMRDVLGDIDLTKLMEELDKLDS